MHHPNRFGRDTEDFGGDLRHRGIRTLPHVYGARADAAASVAVDIHHRHRRRRSHARFNSDGDAAAAPNRCGTAIEWAIPLHPLRQTVQNRVDVDIGHRHPRRVRPAFAQDVSPPKVDRIDIQRTRNDVGLRLVCPHHLRDTEAAQRPSRRLVGINRMAFDGNILDIVRTGGSQTRLLRDPRPDICISAAVPPHFDFAGDDASVLPDSCLEPNCRAVFGDRVELLFHRQRNAHRLSNQESAGGNQRFELDVELAAKSAAQKRRSDADAIFRPAQEPAYFRPDEGWAL